MNVDLRTLEAYVIGFLKKTVNIILDTHLCNFKRSPNPLFEKWFNISDEEVANERVLVEWRCNRHRPVFVKCDLRLDPSHNQISAHFRNSFQSMRAIVSSSISGDLSNESHHFLQSTRKLH